MQTEAIFDNIAERILHELTTAQKSIYIAVAWFTNRNIFALLVDKANKGCTVNLIISNDDINRNSSINFSLLEVNGSRVFKIGNGDTELMHNKFCVIDYSTVITGSYNWSYKAETNFENVIINNNDTTLAEQFIAEFNHIRKQYYPDDTKEENVFPIGNIIKRFEILQNYIHLEDVEALDKEILKLKPFDFNADILEILYELKNQEYALAILKIQAFIAKNQQLSLWTDPEISALKLEVKNLENKLNGFDNEKTELEKLLSEFQHRHTRELGDIILGILRLRKLKYKDDEAKYNEAESDEKQYQEQVEIEKDKIMFELTEEEKLTLKKTFRKATVLCHPDKVSDEFKEAAQSIFIELKAAYDANDLKKVAVILEDLDRGNYFKSRSETVNEKALLKAAIAKLRIQIKKLETDIIAIKQDDTFITVASITNWDEYFNKTKEILAQELEALKMELGE